MSYHPTPHIIRDRMASDSDYPDSPVRSGYTTRRGSMSSSTNSRCTCKEQSRSSFVRRRCKLCMEQYEPSAEVRAKSHSAYKRRLSKEESMDQNSDENDENEDDDDDDDYSKVPPPMDKHMIDLHEIGLENLDISFSGCGFLGIYHVGVVTAFHTLRPDIKFHRICGASAGAIVATALAGGVSIRTMIGTFVEACGEASRNIGRVLNPGFDITEELRNRLHQIFPRDIHLKVRNKLYISLTDLETKKNVLTTYFESRESLIEAILASSFIPVFSGIMPLKYHGSLVVDGGFSSNLPMLCEKTISVSPFAGETHICPPDDIKHQDDDDDEDDGDRDQYRMVFSGQSINFSVKNLFRLSNVLQVPGPTELSDILTQGFQDGFRFLRTHNLVDCHQCMEVTSYLNLPRPADDAYRRNMRPCKEQKACQESIEKNVRPPQHLMDIFKDAANSWGWWNNPTEGDNRVTLIPDWWLAHRSIRWFYSIRVKDDNGIPLDLINMILSMPAMTMARPFWHIMVYVIEYLKKHSPVDLKDEKKTEERLIKLITQVLSTVERFTGYTVDLPKFIYKVEKKKKRAPIRRRLNVTVTQYATHCRERDQGCQSGCQDDEDDPLFPAMYLDLEEGEDSREVIELTYDATDDNLEAKEEQILMAEQSLHLTPGDDYATANNLQVSNLLSVSRSGSRSGSRICSAVASRIASIHQSRTSSRNSSRRGSNPNLEDMDLDMSDLASDTLDGNEGTLSNILNIAESQDAILSYCYRDEDGRIVTRSIYDVTDTDPVDIVGQEILMGASSEEAMRESGEQMDRYADCSSSPLSSSLDPQAVRHQLMSAHDIHPERFVETNSSPLMQRKRVPVVEPEDADSDENEEIYSPEDVRSDPESDWDNNFSVGNA